MENNTIETKYKKLVIALAVIIPLAVAALFGIKIEGYDFSFLPPIYSAINLTIALLLVLAVVAIKKGNQKENISLKTLNNRNKYLQSGYINLNIHVKEVESGRGDLAKFKQILDVIIPLVKDAKFEEYAFQIDDDKGMFRDEDEDSMYFYNLKLKFQTI